MRIDKLAMTSREALQTAMSTAADAQAGAVEPIHLLSALLGAGERNISVIIERIGADPAQLARSTQDAIDRAPKVSGEGQQMGLSNELVRVIEKAEKKAKADEIYKELAAITDQSELMKRFAELKEEYCEDTGKTAYPDGYTFTEGKMVPEFENAVKALEAYEVSEPVQSDYGYHIILRLPDDPDSVIDYTTQNTPMTARKYCANTDYAERMETVLSETTLEYVPGFAQVELADFIK